MEFAGKKDFPESNDNLGAGNNENTQDLRIFRYEQGIIAKFLLTDEEVEHLVKTKCLYLFVKAQTTYPIRIDVFSPFLSAEQIQELENAEIDVLNEVLRTQLSLKRVSRESVLEDADAIIAELGRPVFDALIHLTRLIVRNTKERFEAESSIGKQIDDALKKNQT